MEDNNAEYLQYSYEPRQIAIGKQIAKGGFGNVYSAQVIYPGNREAVYLPVVIKSSRKNDFFVFEREITITYSATARDNPVASAVLGVPILIDERPWLLMEDLPRFGYNPLEDMITRQHRFSRLNIPFIAQQLLETLQYLRDIDNPHLDLKPSNVFCNQKSEIKVLDFGLSEMIMGKDVHRHGTAGYLLPELYLDSNGVYTEQSMMYSIALLVFEIHTKTALFNSQALHAFSQLELKLNPRFNYVLTQLNKEYPEGEGHDNQSCAVLSDPMAYRNFLEKRLTDSFRSRPMAIDFFTRVFSLDPSLRQNTVDDFYLELCRVFSQTPKTRYRSHDDPDYQTYRTLLQRLAYRKLSSRRDSS